MSVFSFLVITSAALTLALAIVEVRAAGSLCVWCVVCVCAGLSSYFTGATNLTSPMRTWWQWSLAANIRFPPALIYLDICPHSYLLHIGMCRHPAILGTAAKESGPKLREGEIKHYRQVENRKEFSVAISTPGAFASQVGIPCLQRTWEAQLGRSSKL